jgi:hypothetical protein
MGKPQASKTRKEINIAAFYNAELFDGESGVLAFYCGYTIDRLKAGFKHKIRIVQSKAAIGKLLVVGCAKGFFVRMALEAGYDVLLPGSWRATSSNNCPFIRIFNSS